MGATQHRLRCERLLALRLLLEHDYPEDTGKSQGAPALHPCFHSAHARKYLSDCQFHRISDFRWQDFWIYNKFNAADSTAILTGNEPKTSNSQVLWLKRPGRAKTAR